MQLRKMQFFNVADEFLIHFNDVFLRNPFTYIDWSGGGNLTCPSSSEPSVPSQTRVSVNVNVRVTGAQ